MRTYVRKNQIEAAVIGDELGLLNIETGKYYLFDSIATDVWNLLETNKSLNEIVNELLCSYDVGKEECERDVKKLLHQLTDSDLLAIL